MIKHCNGKRYGISLILLFALCGIGCQQNEVREPDAPVQTEIAAEQIPTASTPPVAKAESKPTPKRDNTPHVLIPKADGSTTYHNSMNTAVIDASHADNGYIMVSYTGSNPKVKLQITGPNTITYTYDLHGTGYEVFPLTSEDGNYTIAVYESVVSGKYSTALSQKIDVKISDVFGPYLYPSQYVNFDASTKAVSLASDIVSESENDLDAVAAIYQYIITNISYDTDKAANVQTGYLPDVDQTLASKKGICFDYAAVMAAMLRSQNIPTRLEIGFASKSYHAWISTYITDIGWINGIIEFDGKNWTLMDPTFAASSSEKTLKKFIGDGSNYVTEYVY